MSNVSLNNKAFIGFFTLAMINVAAIVNLSNTPTMSVIGPGFISYFVLACVFFFLPTAFVAAELSTAWPLRGGLYDWVKLAFGPEIGFLAVWLQWIANVIWYPTLFAPAIAGVTYLFSPALAANKWYMFSVMVGFFWMLTLVNLQGMRESSLISSIGVILGSILPGAIVVIFSVIWLFKGLPIGVTFHAHEFIPPLTNLNSMSILLGLLVTFAGMEMSVVHAGNVDRPRITYPRAIFLASIIIMAVFVFVSLALTVIIPPEKIDIVSGLMQTIKQFCETMRIDWLLPILGILVGIGSMTMASTWVAGPSRGFHIASFDTGLLRFLQKTNKHDMPNRIMLLQAVLFTLLTSLFLFMPTITNSYWILVALTGQLYMFMYFIMFITGIWLRYKYPNVVREYSIPGKYHIGMWLVAGAGILGTIFSFAMTYYQPNEIASVTNSEYIKFLLIFFFGIVGIPLVLVYWFKYYRYSHDIEKPADHPLETLENIHATQEELEHQLLEQIEEEKKD